MAFPIVDERLLSFHRNVAALGDRTCQTVEIALTSLLTNDLTSAKEVRVLSKDVAYSFQEIDNEYLDITSSKKHTLEENIFLIGSLKIAIEFERICDYASQIARIIQRKFPYHDMSTLKRLAESTAQMKEEAIFMLRSSQECYKKLDPTPVKMIIARDTSVDQKNTFIFKNMICVLSTTPWVQEFILDYHIVTRYIERVADRATNIAELVYYILNGHRIRKNKWAEETL